MPRAKKKVVEAAPQSAVERVSKEHDSLHQLLAFTRGTLLDTVESMEMEREEVRAILREWRSRGDSGRWLMEHYLNRLTVALKMEER
jgi:hypothetical protein